MLRPIATHSQNDVFPFNLHNYFVRFDQSYSESSKEDGTLTLKSGLHFSGLKSRSKRNRWSCPSRIDLGRHLRIAARWYASWERDWSLRYFSRVLALAPGGEPLARWFCEPLFELFHWRFSSHSLENIDTSSLCFEEMQLRKIEWNRG